eukprot:4840449-Pleurochrysis_carterae.AAC.1
MAMRVLSGIDFSLTLNNVSNYKHQSWYVHYLIWIIPQQIFLHGNLWRFSTVAIESRGAKLKKFGRRTVSWRPLAAASAVYSYIDRQTGLPVRRFQSYRSSPMEQMMKQIVAREEASHDTESVFARPERLRLKLELRTCKLKCELADEVAVDDALTMVTALEMKLAP